MQRAAARIAFVGDPALTTAVLQQVRGAADETLPISAQPATAIAAELALTIAVDPTYLEADVLAAVREALAAPGSGLLSPARIGIGVPLYRSRILAVVEAIAGVAAVTAITWQGVAFDDFAEDPPDSSWFDLEQSGDLILNDRGKHG